MIMSRSVEVHPLAIALSVLTGTLLAGIVGALLAVPLVAFVNSTIHALRDSPALPDGDSRLPGGTEALPQRRADRHDEAARRRRVREAARRRRRRRAQRTCESTNGGLTTRTALRRPRTSSASSSPSSTPAAVAISARPMPTRRVGENVPLVTSPTTSPPADEHGHVRARECRGRGTRCRAARGPGRPRVRRRSASRPQNASLRQPDGPARARLHRRDVERQVLAVQRVAHLGAQGVARARARPGARRTRAAAAVSASHSAGVSAQRGISS